MSFWSFGVGIWSHSCLIRVSICWRVRGRLLTYFSFNDAPNVIYRWKIWTVGTLLLRSHAVVIAPVCGFALSLCLTWNRRCLKGSICCSKTFYIPFSIYSTFQNVQAAHTVCNYAPSYHQRCWLLNWTPITHWKVSLLFSLEVTASMISNKNVKFGLDSIWKTGGLCLPTVVSGSIPEPI